MVTDTSVSTFFLKIVQVHDEISGITPMDYVTSETSDDKITLEGGKRVLDESPDPTSQQKCKIMKLRKSCERKNARTVIMK